MITLNELLEDKKYREFFSTVPKTLKPLPGQKPWRVYIQQTPEGSWGKKEYEGYADAFRTIATYRRNARLHDGTIQSRGIAYGPPQRVAKITKGGKPLYHTRNGQRVLDSQGNPVQVTKVVLWRPRIDPSDESHIWCTYCRRPTVFRWFISHHALRNSGLQDMVDPANRRCTICGVREEFVRTTVGTARAPHFDPLSHLAAKRSRTRR